MISIRARIVRFTTRQYFKRISAVSDVGKVRAGFEAISGRLPASSGVRVRHGNIAGINCEWLVPDGCESAPLIFYLHGGAFAVGSPRTHRRMVSHIAKRARMRALLPDYRLAPEYPYPAAVEDSQAVFRGLLDGGVSAAEIAIGGDSAGGNLALATMLALRDDAAPLPAACFLMSPWLDLACTGESLHTRAAADPWFRVPDMPGIVAHYCAREERSNALVSPIYADAANLPPMLIQVGDREILLSDATRMADNVAHAGGDVTLQVWPEMWHVFQFFVWQMPESARAIDVVAKFLRHKMGVVN
jgi:acetyl esterase/lipase